MSELLEKLPPLPPLQFFAITAEIKKGAEIKKTHLLPEFSDLLAEVNFADVFMAWNEEGILLKVEVRKSFEEAHYPDYQKGDALEFFFDTRDLKTAGFPTRFCHHFLVLPKDVQGVQVQELSTFRTEDTHPLCDPDEIEVKTTFAGRGYQMEIFFPAHVLHGYEPTSFDHLGFTYRIHRAKGPSQHFALSSLFYKIEQTPSLWGSLILKR
jgi:hypothetical protein